MNESDRLALLTSLVSRIRDGMAAIQPIAERAKTRFGVPIALVSVLDAERQIYLGNCGLAAPDAPRDQTFCNTTILSPSVTVVEDTLLDRHRLCGGREAATFWASRENDPGASRGHSRHDD